MDRHSGPKTEMAKQEDNQNVGEADVAITLALEGLKRRLTNKLFEAWAELKRRAKGGDQKTTQRLFGVVLGLRISLLECNRALGLPPECFAGMLGTRQLLDDNFGLFTAKQAKDYIFPEL